MVYFLLAFIYYNIFPSHFDRSISPSISDPPLCLSQPIFLYQYIHVPFQTLSVNPLTLSIYFFALSLSLSIYIFLSLSPSPSLHFASPSFPPFLSFTLNLVCCPFPPSTSLSYTL